jgi:hypothetical protein
MPRLRRCHASVKERPAFRSSEFLVGGRLLAVGPFGLIVRPLRRRGIHSPPCPDARLSAPAPAPADGAAAANKPQDDKKYQRADGGVDDRRYSTDAQVDIELGQQPISNEGSCDPDDQVTDESEPGASQDLARQPSSNEPDQQYDNETFA